MKEQRRRTGLVAAAAIAATGVVLSVSNQAVVDDGVGLAFGVVANLTFTIVGVIILWRRPGQGIGRLMLLIGLTFAITTIARVVLFAIDPYGFRFPPFTGIGVGLAKGLTGLAVAAGGVSVVVRFPSGRRTSRLGLAAEACLIAGAVGTMVGAFLPRQLSDGLAGLMLIPLFGAYLMAVVDIVQRYRRTNGLERAQIRWVVTASVVSGSLLVLVIVADRILPWVWTAWIASLILPPVAIGIAITRYHLYDIDRIVSRTIGYGLVTAVLFAVFAIVNVGLQGVLNPATRGDPLIVAGSTLLVAALFNPLRRRVQSIVDRRFNRARYDAERTVEQFSGRLRDELDLATLTGELLRTSVAAVEPAASAVWLRAGGAR